MLDKIKQIFILDDIKTSGRLIYLLKQHPDIIKFCDKQLELEPAYEKITYFIICVVKRIDFTKM